VEFIFLLLEKWEIVRVTDFEQANASAVERVIFERGWRALFVLSRVSINTFNGFFWRNFPEWELREIHMKYLKF
jgi:hypothetical protein